MVLGSDADIREHALAMQTGAAHSQSRGHGNAAAITVPAGQKGELVVSFSEATKMQMACLIPGHYEAGMRGTLQVGKAELANSVSPADMQDHNAHKH
jgi:uncharacterized cupredoxin-like copper-binding protein